MLLLKSVIFNELNGVGSLRSTLYKKTQAPYQSTKSSKIVIQKLYEILHCRPRNINVLSNYRDS